MENQLKKKTTRPDNNYYFGYQQKRAPQVGAP